MTPTANITSTGYPARRIQSFDAMVHSPSAAAPDLESAHALRSDWSGTPQDRTVTLLTNGGMQSQEPEQFSEARITSHRTPEDFDYHVYMVEYRNQKSNCGERAALIIWSTAGGDRGRRTTLLDTHEYSHTYKCRMVRTALAN